VTLSLPPNLGAGLEGPGITAKNILLSGDMITNMGSLMASNDLAITAGTMRSFCFHSLSTSLGANDREHLLFCFQYHMQARKSARDAHVATGRMTRSRASENPAFGAIDPPPVMGRRRHALMFHHLPAFPPPLLIAWHALAASVQITNGSERTAGQAVAIKDGTASSSTMGFPPDRRIASRRPVGANSRSEVWRKQSLVALA
jgi:hypothetical protein